MELAEQDSKAFDDLLAFLQSHLEIEKYEPANEPMISLPNLEIHLSKRKVSKFSVVNRRFHLLKQSTIFYYICSRM